VSSLTPIELSDKDARLNFGQRDGRRIALHGAYLLRTEVHTFAFSSPLMPFFLFSFLLLLMTLIRYVFHSRVMYGVVENCCALYSDGTEFVIRNLNALVGEHHARRYFRWPCC